MRFVIILIIYTTKNVDKLLRLRHSRHRQTPYNLKRVNAHAERRELSTSILDYIIEIWRISNDKNQKWMFKSYMSLAYFDYVISISF